MSKVQIFLHSWKAYGYFVGNIVGRIAMMIFYFTVMVPFAIGVQLFSDPLFLKPTSTNLWRPRETGDQSLVDILRQF